MTARIIRARDADVPAVLARLDAAELAELRAAAGEDDLEAHLIGGVRASDPAWAGFWNDEPACVGGVLPLSLLGRAGLCWNVSTPVIRRCPLALLRGTRQMLALLGERYDVIRNLVSCEEKSLRWLRWAGFELGAEQHVNGVPLRWIERRFG